MSASSPELASPSSVPGADATSAASAVTPVRVLLYSDDVATRDAVRVGVGRRPAKDVEVVAWHECATPAAVIEQADAGGHDLFILDGEAAPAGGLGLTKQLKNEIYNCPPIIVLTGRPADGWLASWSQAEAAVPHPLDPLQLCATIADVVRTHIA